MCIYNLFGIYSNLAVLHLHVVADSWFNSD